MAAEQPQILIVDDEADMCWALESALSRAGYAVTTTCQGAQALELCERQRFALALVDAKLPDLDGLELIALLRRATPATHIVLISGFLDEDDMQIVEGLRQGQFDRFMAKPLDLREGREMARLLCNAPRCV
jgi:DNA-binding response OmpR family regulator